MSNGDTARGFDAALIEAMARDMRDDWRRSAEVWEDTLPWEDIEQQEHDDCMAQATAALTALCAARPDVAALLAGEAVAVPREATTKMWMAGEIAGYEHVYEDGDTANMESAYRAMLAASPYAKEPKA